MKTTTHAGKCAEYLQCSGTWSNAGFILNHHYRWAFWFRGRMIGVNPPDIHAMLMWAQPLPPWMAVLIFISIAIGMSL